jgi:hypothetical protein
MIGFQNQVSLDSLTTRSSLVMLLRTLYRMGLNYCVIPPTGDYAYVVVFTKEQLVSLIERSGEEAFIAEIPKRVVQGLFKPVAIFRSDSSSSDFISNGGFADPERLQVLVIEEDGAKVSSLKEALAPRVPDFPAWWEAPMPFAMCGYGKLHVNHTAMLMFGPDLKRMPVSDIPDKNEFLVTLEGGQSLCSVTFRRLEGDIFVLEDSTSDMVAAEDVAWWAAVGKAWAGVLDQERRSYRRCGEEEAESLGSEKAFVLPCEWEGELLGYFCVENIADKKAEKKAENKAGRTRKTRSSKAFSNKTGEVSQQAEKERASAPRSAKPGRAKKNASGKERKKKAAPKKPGKTTEPDENNAFNILGPQTLGLLAPGAAFSVENDTEMNNGK